MARNHSARSAKEGVPEVRPAGRGSGAPAPRRAVTVAVVGAGAAGLMAALQAARNGAAVTLFEHNDAVGKKLLVTGSGRCNLSNEAVAASAYTCADPRWMETLLARFGVHDLLDVLAGIGVPTVKTWDGWYYPLSDSAHTVVEAFSSALALAGVTLCMPAQVSAIEARGGSLFVRFSRAGGEEEAPFARVIVAAGGKAYPKLGSRGELFPVLERLGHTVVPLRPALAPLLVDLGRWKPLQGVRLDVGATLWAGAQRLAASRGNLIFTGWGLNGPAAMDISHYVSARPAGALELSLDLLAFFRPQFDRLLGQQRSGAMPARVFLGAFFPPRVALILLQNAGLPPDTPLGQASDGALQWLVAQLQDTRLAVRGVRDWDYCQLSAGGVPVSEVDARTMESRRVPGLFLTGETLDVVGPCGGYNLQFAFSSGAVAGGGEDFTAEDAENAERMEKEEGRTAGGFYRRGRRERGGNQEGTETNEFGVR